MWEAIAANRRRSIILISALGGVLILLGYVIGLSIHPGAGGIGVAVAVGIWAMLWLTATMSGQQILLGSVGARQIQHDDFPVLFNVVEEMSIAAGLPKPPRVYVLDTDAPNAFAVGSERDSAVAVTTGLLMRLNRDELQGVIAHEIGHIKNHDTRFMVLAGVMVGAIIILADAFLRGVMYSGRGSRRSRGRGGEGGAIILVALALAILAPLVAQLLYFACSRRREYLADASGALFTRYPEGLASALEKISASASKMQKVNRAVAPMFIVNPLRGLSGRSLFSTHPPTEDRVRVLRAMAGADYAAYQAAYQKAVGGLIIGQQSLAQAKPVPVRQPSAEPAKDDLERAREAVDILHRLDGYIALTCACGLKVKVPPGFKGDRAYCPRCGRAMIIPTAALAAVVAASEAETPLPPTAQPPLSFTHRQGQWESFRCACGNTIQLSPSFVAPQVRCRACGRLIRVTSA